jgi:hypothetical protein
VLDRLRKAGYTNQPLNDIAIIEVPPLAQSAAASLAALLLEGVAVEWAPGVDREIAELTGGFPFFIHHCALLARDHGTLAVGQAKKLLEHLFRDPHDRGNLRHFRKRLADYYGPQAALAASILDLLAKTPASRGQILNRLRHENTSVEEDPLHDLLDQLEQDHYLARNDAGHYAFRYGIIERWWRFDREIA